VRIRRIIVGLQHGANLPGLWCFFVKAGPARQPDCTYLGPYNDARPRIDPLSPAVSLSGALG
jgi:hypothetical protein